MAKKIRIWTGSQWVEAGVSAQDLTGVAYLNSPEFTGIPTAPTADSSTSTTQIATTAFVQSLINPVSPDGINTAKTYQLDDISALFDAETTVFFLKNEGSQVNILNPFRLLLSIDGIIQSVYTKEIFWQSMFPQTGFTANSDGSIEFSEPPGFGSTFDAKLLPGDYTTTKTKTYPFRAVDIALGA